MALDSELVRNDFPVLKGTGSGRPAVYLDSAATSQKPRSVIAAMNGYYERFCANVHRGSHAIATEATAAYEAARDKVTRFVGAPAREGVIFTKNCTEAINLVAYAWARRELKAGDEILLTAMEHHSNLVPWQMVAQDTGAVLRHIPILAAPGRGRGHIEAALDLEQLDELVCDRTRLIAVTGMSNLLGAKVDLAPIVAAAKAVGALVLVDAAQLVAHAPVDFERLGIDFLAFSGHKMLGPTGIGVLVGRVSILEKMSPFLGGGEMVRSATLEQATWSELPYKFEAGTPPVAEAIGLGAAVDYLESLGSAAMAEHEAVLTAAGLEALGAVEGLVLYGNCSAQGRAPIFAFNLGDGEGGMIHPHDVETLLAEQGFAIRGGHQCAKPLLLELGVAAACRASCAFYNTPAELEALAEALGRARRFLLSP